MLKIKKLIINTSTTAIVFMMLIVPVISFATSHVPAPAPSGATVPAPASSGATVPAPKPVKIYNPLGGKDGKGIEIPALIKKILEGALKIFIPVVALAIIYCGFLFVFAMGNPEKLKKAKDALLYTLIGTAILFGAWAIATLIVNTVEALDK